MKKIIKRAVAFLASLTLEYGLIMGITWLVVSIVNWTRLFNGYYPINNEIATIVLFITVIVVILKRLINALLEKLEKAKSLRIDISSDSQWKHWLFAFLTLAIVKGVIDMITRKGKVLIFVIALIGVVTWSVLNWAIGIQGMNYLEQDIEHNQIVFNGIVYGVGLGSLSFCSRCVGCGVAGIILSVMSCWIFPTWMKVTQKEETD